MKLSTTTQIQASIDAHIAELPTTKQHELTYAVLKIEQLRGELMVAGTLDKVYAFHAREAAEKGTDPMGLNVHMSALLEVMDLLLRGADDSWSGRSNDGKRAYFDGVREGARSAKYKIESQIEKLLPGTV